jgi:hypothetical protein
MLTNHASSCNVTSCEREGGRGREREDGKEGGRRGGRGKGREGESEGVSD